MIFSQVAVGGQGGLLRVRMCHTCLLALFLGRHATGGVLGGARGRWRRAEGMLDIPRGRCGASMCVKIQIQRVTIVDHDTECFAILVGVGIEMSLDPRVPCGTGHQFLRRVEDIGQCIHTLPILVLQALREGKHGELQHGVLVFGPNRANAVGERID